MGPRRLSLRRGQLHRRVDSCLSAGERRTPMPALSVHLPAPVAEAWDWQLSAACRDADPAVFFHRDNERGEPRESRVRAAKRICRRCPVRARCLNYALEAYERHGIWGGYTEDERRTLQRMRDVGRSPGPSRPGSDNCGWTLRSSAGRAHNTIQ
ncbi:WhiB family transcriptional regulator [Rhodococcus opacus]|uniref:WhiB family transcriptional regulator n=1 Tax=Rhodococcus opacus TaxID=37919 RepID=UPI002E167138